MQQANQPFRAFSYEAFTKTIHCGHVALWSWDPLLEVAYLDPLAMSFWGVQHERMTLDDLWDRVHADQRAATIEAWRNSALSDAPYEFTFQIDHPDTQPRWIAARGMGTKDAVSAGEVLAVFVDVTDDVQAQMTQQTLVREMGHRISNLFSVTGGILQMTKAKHSSVSEYADDLERRFAQLANAYRAIMRSPKDLPGRISVAEALSALLSPYGVSEAQMRFDLDPAPEINDQQVTSLALIVHELVTNALKYGALSHDDGRLLISLKLEDEVYSLKWVETGAKIKAQPDELKAGFGERLIHQTAQMSFSAEVEREFPEDGLSFKMLIPKDQFYA